MNNSKLHVGRAIVVGTIVLLLAGCIGPLKPLNRLNPFGGGGSKSSEEVSTDGPAKLVEFIPEVGVERIWSRKIGKGLGKKYLEISPAVVDDMLIVADAYGLVFGLNRLTGEEIWRTRVGRPDRKGLFNLTDRSDRSFVAGGVGIGEGLALVGTVRGFLIALDAGDGKELWRAQLSGEVLAPAVAGAGIVAVQTSDGKLFALEIEDGSVRWIYDTQDPIVTLRGTGSPAIGLRYVYAGFANGIVASIDIASGFPIWEQRVSLPEGTSELERMVDVDGRPLVMEGVVYAVSHQGQIRALARNDGSILWEKADPSHRPLVEGFDLLFVVRDDDVIVAAAQNGGSEIWRQDALYLRELSDPLAFGNYLVVGDRAGYMHVFAQSDGRLLGRHKVGSSLRSPMAEQDGIVYTLNKKGRLRALRISRIE